MKYEKVESSGGVDKQDNGELCVKNEVDGRTEDGNVENHKGEWKISEDNTVPGDVVEEGNINIKICIDVNEKGVVKESGKATWTRTPRERNYNLENAVVVVI